MQGCRDARIQEQRPAGASFDTATQLVTWTPWHNQIGLHTFRFTAAGQAEKIVTVEVHPVENSPWRVGARNILRQQGQEVR